MNVAVWAEVLRGVALFLAGYGAGMVTMTLWNRRIGERVPLNRVVAVAILAVVMGGSLMGVWNSYQMREQAACQSEVNRQFLGSLSSNVDLNRANRDNLDSTIERLAEADPDDDGREVLADYLAEREHIESERETYPPLPEEVCE